MKNLKAKLRKNGGFTLIEMLIVVAIIAILVAVSIPLVSNALERTRHATDEANERAAKAELLVQYLADEDATIDNKNDQKIGVGTVYYYNAATGGIETTPNSITPYGKHHHDNAYLALKIDDTGRVSMFWASAAAGVDGNTSWDGNLCGGKDVANCK